jgi:DegV family protein with EDD domain
MQSQYSIMVFQPHPFILEIAMPRIALVTNTAAAIPSELVARYGITLMPMQIHFLDGRYDEGDEISNEEFYMRLLREDVVPSTSPPSVGRYARVFQQLAAEYDVILSIHISQALSGSYHSALAAIEQVRGAKIYLHDSGSASLGTGLQALTAARLAEQGAGIDALLAALQRQRERTLMMFAPATLKYMRNSGRLGPLAMMIAAWLNIKPLIKVSDGKLELLDRARSWGAALDRQISEIVSFSKDEAPAEIAICHVNALAAAEALAERVRQQFPQAQIYIADAGPAMAVHIGPGALGLATYLP